METILFTIGYILTLKDGSFLETKTYVVAANKEIAAIKLELWRKTQKPEFDKIEINSIESGYNVII